MGEAKQSVSDLSARPLLNNDGGMSANSNLSQYAPSVESVA